MSDEPEMLALPLDGWHRARGARMVPFAGYSMPIQYEGIMAEHLWTRQSAGLFDVSHMGQLLVTGPGADVALEALLPADITALGDGRMRYSLLLAEDGGILDDLMVTRVGSSQTFAFVSGAAETRLSTPLGTNGLFYIVVNGATKWDDIAHLHEHLPDTVTLNHMDDQALLALQGPRAAEALARLAPGVEALRFMTAGQYVIGGVPAWISRSGYTGEDGFEISVRADAAIDIADRIAGQPEVKPIGLGARDSLRLEAGLPLHGHDIDAETTPIAADLGFAISRRRRAEGGFPGAGRILAELADGAIQQRVGLAIDGRQPVREGALVLDAEGSEVGRITSGGFSPSLQRPIAMAYVPQSATAPGTSVTISQRGKLFTGQVVAMPFVPHRYHRTGAPA